MRLHNRGHIGNCKRNRDLNSSDNGKRRHFPKVVTPLQARAPTFISHERVFMTRSFVNVLEPAFSQMPAIASSPSLEKTYTVEPPVWFHDILCEDGTPLDGNEVAYIKSVTKARGKPVARAER
jgi:hypothetical protein